MFFYLFIYFILFFLFFIFIFLSDVDTVKYFQFYGDKWRIILVDTCNFVWWNNACISNEM